MIDLWIRAITKPVETFTAETNNPSLRAGIINFFIAGIIVAIVSFIYGTIIISLLGNLPIPTPSIIDQAIAPIIQVITGLIMAGMFFIFAKLLGGQGNYTSIFYLSSLYAVPLAIAGAIPVVGFLFVIYTFYLLYLVIKISQKLSTGRAVLTVLIPFVLLSILAIILIILIGVSVLSLFSSVPPTGLFGL